MKAYFRFSIPYLLLTILLFTIEVLIAKYLHDQVIRPYVGDVLVVILIYCFVRSFFRFPVLPTAIATLLFAFLIETLQYFDIVHLLGLGKYYLARVVIGTSFEWIDLAAYTLGTLIVLGAEKVRS
ncbi:DUF2809 domain-containing protein [Parasegetibacter sp. NRK P23]|uniref:ribosomal maturation YjgA family protein n=1 Tax=Parasegetibacter sp. NRK P23 TaxID=2942999 RepID=UPI002043AB9B|nr:DUF2809 domain-containing protein [Parasegetibacter sp. NRK P23]MCM5530486.1 DUF2809 domain-containing protein [Parasegetibacter sp. NRK P23]